MESSQKTAHSTIMNSAFDVTALYSTKNLQIKNSCFLNARERLDDFTGERQRDTGAARERVSGSSGSSRAQYAQQVGYKRTHNRRHSINHYKRPGC